MRRSLLPVVLAFATAACSAGVPVATSEPVTTIAAFPTTTAGATSSTLSDAPTSTEHITDVEVADGVVSGPAVFTIALGDTFSALVLSDSADEIHVHGYDLHFDLEPGVPLEVDFVAGVPGIFEVELEGAQIQLFEIEVEG